MSLTLKPSQLKTLLSKSIECRAPVLITGAPGIGKSDIVSQVTAATGSDFILSHPAVADPTDAKGLPWVGKDARSATFLPFGELASALRAKKPTVWFIDDLGQAPPAVQASFMQLLLARRVNDHRLPDCVTFVAATNRRTDRAGVSGILEPVKSRFLSIVELAPDMDEWCTWALDELDADAGPKVVAFIRFRPNLLSDFRPTADLTNSPTPRTWAHAAKIVAMGLPRSIEITALAGAVGEGAAVELSSFLSMYAQLPSIDAALVDPDKAKIPSEPSALYATTTALAARANEKNFSRLGRYATRLVEEGHGEFAVLLIRDAQRKEPKVTQTADYVRLMAGELGQLISGTN